MDGKFNPESMCFILTQTDQHFEYIKYANDHLDLMEECSASIEQLRLLAERQKDNSKDLKTAKTGLNSSKKAISVLLSQMEDILKSQTFRAKSGSADATERK